MRLTAVAIFLLTMSYSRAQFKTVPDSIQIELRHAIFTMDFDKEKSLINEVRKGAIVAKDTIALSWVYMSNGTRLDRFGESSLSLMFLDTALNYAEVHGSPSDRILIHSEMSRVFSNQQKDSLALRHYKRMQEIAANESPESSRAILLSKSCDCQISLNRSWNNQTDSICDAALENLSKLSDSIDYHVLKLLFVTTQVEQDVEVDPGQLKALSKDIVDWSRSKGYNLLLANSLLAYSVGAYYTNEVEKGAIPAVEEAIQIFEEHNLLAPKIQSVHGIHAQYLHSAWRYEEESAALKKVIEVGKSFQLEESRVKLEELQRTLDIERVEQEKELANQEVLLMEAKNGLYIALLLVLSLVVLLAALLFITWRTKVRREAVEKEQRIKTLIGNQEQIVLNAMVEGRERERKYVARELHDRIGSLLAAVRLRFHDLDEVATLSGDMRVASAYSDADRMLQESVSEVRLISKNLGEEGLSSGGFRDSMKALESTINKSDLVQMKVELNLGDSQMTGPLALSLYRITQELVTNSLRHGKADNIHVTLNAFDEELNFLYEDDGIGFSKEKIKRGMGLSNVESRIQEQNGTVTIDSSPGKGMVLVADFHLK